MIKVKVDMWGNSLGIHIPKHIADLLEIKCGDELTLELKKKDIELRLVK